MAQRAVITSVVSGVFAALIAWGSLAILHSYVFRAAYGSPVPWPLIALGVAFGALVAVAVLALSSRGAGVAAGLLAVLLVGGLMQQDGWLRVVARGELSWAVGGALAVKALWHRDAETGSTHDHESVDSSATSR